MKAKTIPTFSFLLLMLLVQFAPAQKLELVVQTGHSGSVNSVAYSPDGKLLASGGSDGVIKLWHVPTGSELRALSGHADAVRSVAFSPDGKVIASGSADQTIILWDALSGRQLRSLKGHTAGILSIAFNSNGQTLASSADDQKIKVWDIATGAEKRELSGHERTVTALAYSPDGKLLASASADKTIRLWDAESGAPRLTINTKLFLRALAFSPDGQTLASGSQDYYIKFWRVADGAEVRTFTGNPGMSNSIAYSPDGKRLISAKGDGLIELWTIETGQRINIVGGTNVTLNAVAFNPDGQSFASGGDDKTIKLWDVTLGQQVETLKGRSSPVTSLAFTPDGRLLASGSADGTIKLWPVGQGPDLRVLSGHDDTVFSVAFSPDGKTLASGSADYTVKVWDVLTGKQVRMLRESSAAIRSVVFSRDGQVLAAAADYGIHLWDAATGTLRRTLDPQSGPIYSIAFSPDGKTLACGVHDGTIMLWEVATGTKLRAFNGHTEAVRTVSFSPDGQTLASGSVDQTIRLWDVATGVTRQTLKGHTSGVGSVVFGRDGRTLASGAADNSVRIWNLANGQVIRSFVGHTGGVNAVALHPTHGLLASAGDDTSTRLWETRSGKLRFNLLAIDERDWVALSPDGRFDGSADGINLIHYVHENQPIPLDSFFEKSFTPRLLAGVGSADMAAEEIADRQAALSSEIRLKRTPPANTPPAGGKKKLPAPASGRDSSFEQFSGRDSSSKLIGAAGGNNASTLLPSLSAVSLADFSKSATLPPLVTINAKTSQPKEMMTASATAVPPPGERARGLGVDGLPDQRTPVAVDVLDQGGGIELVRLYHNDKLVAEERNEGTATAFGSTVKKTFFVALVPGTNELKATALNRERTESAPAKVRVTLPSQAPNVNLYIIAVGMNAYQNPKYNLNYGRVDAEAFAAEVEKRGQGIFQKIEKVMLYDAQATRAGIEAAFAKIGAAARPQDAFVFFYAGHGVMSEGVAPAAASDFHLVPYDVTQLYGDDQMLADKAISAKRLKELCTQVRAQKQLIVFDACQSGGAVEAFSLRGASEEKAISQLARSAGIVVLAASGTEQLAAEFPKLGHGVFTYALLRGLGGEADGGTQPDGKITVKELEAFLNDIVPELSRQYRGKAQYPNSYARGQDFPLGVK